MIVKGKEKYSQSHLLFVSETIFCAEYEMTSGVHSVVTTVE